MSDETKSTDQPDGPAPGTVVDLEALVKEMNAGWDKRFQGFQSLLDRRDAEYRETLESLKNADLSPEEREQAQASKLHQEIEKLRRENEILARRKDFPEEVDLLDKFLKSNSLEEQLALLSTFRKAEAPSAPGPVEGEAAADGKPTPANSNNPARPSVPGLDAAAERMNKELADQILSSAGNDKGILARLRRSNG